MNSSSSDVEDEGLKNSTTDKARDKNNNKLKIQEKNDAIDDNNDNDDNDDSNDDNDDDDNDDDKDNRNQQKIVKTQTKAPVKAPAKTISTKTVSTKTQGKSKTGKN